MNPTSNVIQLNPPSTLAPPEPIKDPDLGNAWARVEALETIVLNLTREAQEHFERANAIDGALREERTRHQASLAEIERLRRELAIVRNPITIW